MRNFYFTFKNEKERDYVFDEFVELFKGTKELETKDIVFCKVSFDGTYKLYLSINDSVPGSFGITIMNSFGEPMKLMFMAVKAECGNIDVELPKDVMIGTDYCEDKHYEKKEEKAT